jgi:uncharacterized glyoxalase superfamily protein PhnB
VSDDLEKLRRSRPDRPDDAADPGVFTREKERLMAMIGNRTTEAESRAASRMYPRLAYLDEAAALEYLTRVFGFRELREARRGSGTRADPMLAWLAFGDGIVMIGRANHEIHRIYSPAEVGQSTVMINVDVDDIDAHYARAVAAGARITMPLEDAFYGDRRYEATDLEGHRWHFSESFERIRARGGREPET